VNADELNAAACGMEPPDLFFPSNDEQLRQALEVCAGCPVREACAGTALQLAMELRDDQHYGLCGVWAGQLWRGGMVIPSVPRAGRRRAAGAA
jgi:WhiB family redox-sensing transcriptional regulator